MSAPFSFVRHRAAIDPSWRAERLAEARAVLADVIHHQDGLTRGNHPAPPDGPKALDRAMERAAQRQAQASGGKTSKRRRKTSDKSRMSLDEMAVFYADLVNSDKFMAPSTISNTTRNAMLARGLVTPDRLRMRGVL